MDKEAGSCQQSGCLQMSSPASENWNMRGQRALLTDDEIEEVGNSLRILRGSSLTRKDAETAFIKHQDKIRL
jgi:hypothetical protein